MLFQAVWPETFYIISTEISAGSSPRLPCIPKRVRNGGANGARRVSPRQPCSSVSGLLSSVRGAALFGTARLGEARLGSPAEGGDVPAEPERRELRPGRCFPALCQGSCEPWLPKDGPQLSAGVSFAAVKTQRSAFKEKNLDNRCGG